MSYHRVAVKENIKKVIVEEAKKRGCTQSDIITMALSSFCIPDKSISIIDKGKGSDSISLYLTPTEKDLLKQLANKNGLSASRYIASIVRIDAGLLPIDKAIVTELRKLINQVRRVGINLNQQTRAINRKIEENQEEFKDNLFIEYLKETQDILREVKHFFYGLFQALELKIYFIYNTIIANAGRK